MIGSVAFRAIGVDCQLVATDRTALPAARRLTDARLGDLDAVASRFRPDSEVMRLAALPAGNTDETVTARATPLLRSLLDGALWAADVTAGLVDPTLGRAMECNGYDADLAVVLARAAADEPTRRVGPNSHPGPASTLPQLRVDDAAGTITMAAGALLDLGATAKAATADRLAGELAQTLPGGFLVNLGGDIAVAGDAPAGGWVIAADDENPEDARISITCQGVATSGTNRRRWEAGGVTRHHLLDPATGYPVQRTWLQVSCVGASALEANAATTAACVLGDDATGWLTERRIPARLVSATGDVSYTPGWPRSTSSRRRAS